MILDERYRISPYSDGLILPDPVPIRFAYHPLSMESEENSVHAHHFILNGAHIIGIRYAEIGIKTMIRR